ncbi:MAG TPA: hypothetical protein VMI12_09340 [Puia sp.]|nr:hypothetical protein [Puia sp.]
MKTFLPAISLVLILAISVVSSILYLNMNYVTSAVLTIVWIVGITLWIGARIKKQEEAR